MRQRKRKQKKILPDVLGDWEDVMTRIIYQEELKVLNKDVIHMGEVLQVSIDKMIKALNLMDADLAREIIADDDQIDGIECGIETKCINLIAKQAPVATDLRKISSYMRIISDIERIADHCCDISEYILLLSEEKEIPMPSWVVEMITAMRQMVAEVIEAFVDEDAQKAYNVMKADDVVDDYFGKIKSELCIAMKHNPERISQYVDYLMIIKYLERMADHSTNIAKWITFMITGNLEL